MRHHPDPVPRRGVGDHRIASSGITAPVGLHGESPDDALGARGDGVEERLRVYGEAVFRVGLHDHRRRACQLDLLGDGRPVRRVRDDLVAFFEQRNGGVQRLFCAGRDDCLFNVTP